MSLAHRLAEAPEGTRALQTLVMRRALVGLWRHLPALAVAGLVTGAVSALAVHLWPGAPILVPALAAVAIGPTVGPLCAVVRGILTDDSSSLREYRQAYRWSSLGSLAVTAPVGVSISLSAAAFVAWDHTGSVVFVPSVVLCCVCAFVLTASLPAAMCLAVARPQVRGVRRWTTAVHLTGRWPARFLAPASVLIAGVLAAQAATSTLVLLVPALWALMSGCAYWCSAVQMGADDVQVHPHGGIQHP